VKTWVFAFSVLFTIAVILLLLNYSRLDDLFHTHVRDRPKRRLLLAAIGFFVTFAVACAMAWGAYRNVTLFTTFTLVERISTTSSGAFSFCWLWDFAG
jgi:multisubunit Na+/H+ antiporter MnhB subunit